MVSSTPRPYFTPGKDPVPIVQEAGWASGPVWTGGKSRPTGIHKLSGYSMKFSVTSQNWHVFRESKDIQKLQILWKNQPLFFQGVTDGASSLLCHDHTETPHTYTHTHTHTHSDTPQSVRFLWKSDGPIVETSI